MHPLERDVLIHRYLYYVLARPIMSDYDYDRLEKCACKVLPPESPAHQVGSDLASDYPPEIVAAAEALLDLPS